MSTIKVFAHPDRPAMPPGPWDEEPDKAIWVDGSTDLDCMAVRNPGSGAWCGYVGVGPDHPWHGKNYHDVDEDMDVHGGLTFAADCQPDERGEAYGVCHVASPGREHNIWWFGFDCAHWQDLAPGYDFGQPAGYAIYRDFTYVMDEVKNLAAQLDAVNT